MRQLAGRVAVITGAGGGIGRALALDLARRRARLALSDRNEVGVAETARLCRGLGVQARHYGVDVSDAGAVLRHANQVRADFGAVNVVVNNAGVALIADALDAGLADVARVMDVDFWGVVHGTTAFLPHLIASGDGHLVNVSSVFGLMAAPQQSAYNAAKFAVRGYTEALRMEMRLAGHPVGVTCVHPGGVATDIVRNAQVAGDVRYADVVRRFDAVLARSTPEQAAAAIVRGIRRDRARVLIGADAFAIDALVRVLGPAYQRVIVRVTRRAGRFAGPVTESARDRRRDPLGDSATRP